jgi:hypothetical protein
MRTADRRWSLKGTALVALGLGATVLAGCARDRALVPAPTALVVAGEPRRAVERQGGVQVTVHGEAWQGEPRNLETVLTPMHVTIQNASGRPVRVRYQAFVLRGTSGQRYEALSPLHIDKPGPVQSQIVPIYTHDRFWVAPHLSPFYPNLQRWYGAFPYDPVYYARVRWRAELPTRDMLRRALPEGVVEHGGQVSGFLYFPRVVAREQQVLFTAELAEGRDGVQVAAVRIPFVIR